jgi:hypothetical protein
MSMPHLKGSIQELLHLQATLPRSLSDQLRVNNSQLIGLHDQFVDMASELRLWSFYETRESLLSGSAAGLPSEVQFDAPLVSVKSALVDLWQEDVYAMDSDHAHLASFGPRNAGILDSYLADLAEAIRKAALLSSAYTHTPLHLRSRVKVEIVGFYEDPGPSLESPRPYTTEFPGAETGSIIRLYSTRYSLKEFLRQGPELCLAERLHRGQRGQPSQLGSGGNAEPQASAGTDSNGLDFPNLTTDSSLSATAAFSPAIAITSPSERPSLLRAGPAQSEPTVRPSSPESTASVSTTVSEPAPAKSGELSGGASHQVVDILAKQKARILIKQHALTAAAGLPRPDPSLRKFMWVHMPYNNPVWVKVRNPRRIFCYSKLEMLTLWDRKPSRPSQERKG